MDEILHLPVAQVVEGEVEFGFSCSEKSILASCEVDCFTNQALDFRLQKIPEASNVYTSRVFWSYVALVLTTWIAFAVVTSVADALCFQSLGIFHYDDIWRIKKELHFQLTTFQEISHTFMECNANGGQWAGACSH